MLSMIDTYSEEGCYKAAERNQFQMFEIIIEHIALEKNMTKEVFLHYQEVCRQAIDA